MARAKDSRVGKPYEGDEPSKVGGPHEGDGPREGDELQEAYEPQKGDGRRERAGLREGDERQEADELRKGDGLREGDERQEGDERALRIREAADPRMSRSLEYGLATLECFSVDIPALGIAQLARTIGIGRSTAHRYASTLAMLGYLEQDPKRKYRLAATTLEPGLAAIGAVRLLAPSLPVLEDLRDWTGHTVGLGVLDRTRAIYVHRLHAHGRGQYQADLDLRAGACLPLYRTALGKALMASLPNAKRAALLAELEPNSIPSPRKLAADLRQASTAGLAISDEELAPGVRSIAAAVTVAGTLPLAIDVTAPSTVRTLDYMLDKLGPLVQRAAERVSQAARS